MINGKAAAYIDSAAQSELESIIARHGETYASAHEGYAVLKEEIEETCEEIDAVKENLDKLWEGIRENFLPSALRKSVGIIQEKAYYAAEEAVQVIAVCSRFSKTLEKEQ